MSMLSFHPFFGAGFLMKAGPVIAFSALYDRPISKTLLPQDQRLCDGAAIHVSLMLCPLKMCRAGWEAEVPDSSEVMELVGRITSNNFGLWLPHGGAVAAGRQAAAAEMARSSMGAASTSSSEADLDVDKPIGRVWHSGGPPLVLGSAQQQPGSGQTLSRWPLGDRNVQELQQPGNLADDTTVAGLPPSSGAGDADGEQLGSRTSKGDRPHAGPLSNGKHNSGSGQQGDSQGYVLSTALSSHGEQLEPGEAGSSSSGQQPLGSSFGEADRRKVEGRLSDMVLDESGPQGPCGTGAALQEASAATCVSGSASESSSPDAGEGTDPTASRPQLLPMLSY